MTTATTTSEVVSFDDEALILVDAADRPVGYLDKSGCHDGEGVLHRAFSAFIFNPSGELLVQQRASDKRLWPAYWSNSCCSHPRRGEDIELAVTRRLEQELGFSPDDLNSLEFLYKFEYVAHFGEAGTEHELCSVFVGHTSAAPVVNTAEIKAWAWLGKDQLTEQLAAEPDRFTPWLQLEWAKLSADYAQKIA